MSNVASWSEAGCETLHRLNLGKSPIRSVRGAMRVAALAIAAAVANSSADAAEIFGRNFQLNSVAGASSDSIQLTASGVTFSRASAFATSPIDISADHSVEISFSFEISGGTDGADGLVLVFQAIRPGFRGESGGNLGFYGSIINGGPSLGGHAYGVAFDTWLNAKYGDIGSNNISFIDSTTYQLRKTIAAPMDLNSGDARYVWVDYDGMNTVSVFLNALPSKPDTAIATDSIDLAEFVGGNPYVGFTAATGGSTNSHVITGFDIAAAVPEPSTWALVGCGLSFIALFGRRRR